MRQRSDAWYVRLPDGRVLRASSTNAVRHHLTTGRLPLESRVRRSADEEWAGLEWTQEFADLVHERLAEGPAPAEPSSLDVPATLAGRLESTGIAARLDPLQLQTVGVRGYVEELLGALDSTLVRSKMLIAATGGLLSALVIILLDEVAGLAPAWQLAAGGGLVLLLIAVVCSSLLTQMCYVELCRLRPARWAEARSRLPRHVFHLALSALLVVGAAALAIYGVRHLPGWLLADSPWPADARLRETLGGAAAALAVILEVVLWLVLVFALLLPPIVIVEECNLFTALGQWFGLLRQHLSRAFLYEALAVVPALVITAGLLLPIQGAVREQAAGLAAAGRRYQENERGPAGAVRLVHDNWVPPIQRLLHGLAIAPLTAFLAVANVFIYLNLRYELEPRRR